MKQVFTLLCIVLLFSAGHAQIIMSSSDMPTSGWTQRVAKDTLPLPAVNFGNKGVNQTYDFSNFVSVLTDTIEYRMPTQSQLDSIPGADLAITTDGTNFLLTQTTFNKFILKGFEGNLFGSTLQARYNPAGDLFQFPTQYNNNFSGTAVLTKTVPGSAVGQPLVYRIRLTVTTQYKDTIDGWGKVITPLGAYKGLRKKRVETTTTLVEAQYAQGFPFSQVSNSTNTTTRYTYPTREAKGSVVTFDYDSLNNVTGVTWSLIPPSIPFANFSHASGGGGLVLFTDLTDGYPDTYSWDFGDGSPTSNQQNPNHIYAANGAYYVCLTVSNAGGSNVYCDSVYVTGITAANNPPVAVDDVVSMTQATSITIFHVGTNDIDPDADNFCMDSVWGSPYVTEYIGGTCDMVSIDPDTCYTGVFSFFYRICDDGTPSLCDTGMVTVTVNPDPAFIAAADFTMTFVDNYDCQTVTVTHSSDNYSSVLWEVLESGAGSIDSSNSDTLIYNDPTPLMFEGVVCLTAYNQCTSDLVCDTVSWICEGIALMQLSGISIYPNPTSDYLVIDMTANTDDITKHYVSVEIYNSIGEKVRVIGRNDYSTVVNVQVGDLASGTYIAVIAGSDGMRKTLGQFTRQ